MRSRAHLAAIGFLQGGLIAVVAQVVAAPMAGAAALVPGLAPFTWLVRAFVPVAGFAAAGAVGGDALRVGSRGAMAFAEGGALTGAVLLVTSSNLSGLTGFEAPSVVFAYATVTSGAAFGIGGLAAGISMRVRHLSWRTGAFFGLGGVIGGVLAVAPFFAALTGSAAQLLWLAASTASVLVPLGLGGALTARVLDRVPQTPRRNSSGDPRSRNA
jgi:hypothetical protein